MRGRGGVVLALATIVAAALASTAGAGSSGVARTQAVNCNGTLKIGIITPLTGGAGFLGQEQLSWTRYARLDARQAARAQGPGRARRHAGREGAGRGPRRRPEDDRRLAARRRDRPGDVGRGRVGLERAVRGRDRAHLAVGDAHVADAGVDEGGDGGVLPGRAGRLHPGPDRRELHGRQAQREEGRADRLPGAVLGGSRRRGRGGPQAQGRHDDPAVDVGEHDRLLVARHPRPERHGRRLLPDPAAARRADVRSAAPGAGQAREGVRR